MKEEKTDLTGDSAAWLLNVSTSVLIVFVNKLLMDSKHGYGFVYASILCALHFFVSGFCVRGMFWLGYGSHVQLPLKDVLFFSFIAGTSVASLNLSLLVNSVGFYQVSKLLIIPFVCVVEAVWQKRRYTFPILASIIVVVIGVSIVTVTDVSVNALGFFIAMISVASSGMQQILCGTVQKKHNVTSNQLLSNTAPVQGVLLLLVGPGIDKLVSGMWVTQYHYTWPAVACLAVSCTIAVLVNISQFMCLGRFSALTFQVLGHAKTVLVLLVGWLYLHDQMNPRKLLGICLAVTGMVLYGWLNSRAQTASTRLTPTTSLKEKGLAHALSYPAGGVHKPLLSTASYSHSRSQSHSASQLTIPLLDPELGKTNVLVVVNDKAH